MVPSFPKTAEDEEIAGVAVAGRHSQKAVDLYTAQRAKLGSSLPCCTFRATRPELRTCIELTEKTI